MEKTSPHSASGLTVGREIGTAAFIFARRMTSGYSSPMSIEGESTKPASGAANGTLAFRDRLVAQTVRIRERATANRLPTREADEAGRKAGGDFEHRIVVRAHAIDESGDIVRAVDRAGRLVVLAAVVLCLLAALAGGAAARAALSPDPQGQVNVFALLFGLLAINLLALAGWVLSLAVRSDLPGILGGATRYLAGRFAYLGGGDPETRAAFAAILATVMRGRAGRWTLGTATNGIWFSFLLAATVVLLFEFSTKSFVFVWETTILSADVYSGLTLAIAWLPSLVGFPVPDGAAVAASEAGAAASGAAAHRDEWAGLVIGSLALYGLLPRALLAGLCFMMLGSFRRDYRLDTTEPGFAELKPVLAPAVGPARYADAHGDDVHEVNRPGRGRYAPPVDADPAGPLAIIGLEVAEPASGWPPKTGAAAILDLGRVDGRSQLRAAVERLRTSKPAPSGLLIVCSLVITPDRGLRSQIEALVSATRAPVTIVLTGGSALRDRVTSADATTRVSDWRALAGEFVSGHDNLREVDLDRLTDVSRMKLSAIGGTDPEGDRPGGRLPRAFGMIEAQYANLRRADASGRDETGAELHRDIARLYSGDADGFLAGDWSGLAGKNLVPRLQAGAELFTDVLPGRLVANRKWLMAGALAGAMGCIAAATVASPVAIAALPLWSGSGAAVAAVLSSMAGTSDPAPEQHAEGDSQHAADTIRAAALFALVLDAQELDEMSITRVIDDAIGEDDTMDLDSAEAVREWLDRVQTRYATAFARERNR